MIERTAALLSYDKILILVFQIIIGAFGEEIAWRSFFVGKSMRFFPFWVCAPVSALFFAAGHISVGNFGMVFYNIATVFIDSVIYAIIYKKSGNCLICTVSHILCNASGIAFTLLLL